MALGMTKVAAVAAYYYLNNLHRTLRQRTHEGPSVRLRHDSIVENHDNAAITFGANEAADSLTQFQDCFRQRVFSEGVATACFDIFQFRLDPRAATIPLERKHPDRARCRLRRDAERPARHCC